jgi:iron complex outermembrane receptor protein
MFPARPAVIVGVLALLAPAAAFGADAAPAPISPVHPGPLALPAFAVTGSFLNAAEADSLRPLTILTADEINARGLCTPGEWLATLPQASRVPITESQASGADARGDIATVSLRGLGSGNTLVLLNGRRLAPHPISMPEGTSGVLSLPTNVNLLPTAAIARVEVLRDGASALYGSDATAGVINTILRHDDIGTELSARFLTTQHGGGMEYRAAVAHGIRDPSGRTSLVFSYDYFRRDEIRASDRAFSRSADFRARAPGPWDGTTADLSADLRSDRGFYGRFQRGTVNADGTISGQRPAGVATTQVSANGTFYFVPTGPGAVTRTLQATEPDPSPNSPVSAYYLNVNQFRLLVPTTARHHLEVGLEHALPGGGTFFAETTYYRADSRNQREASRIDATADNNVTVGIDNPYNPFGSRFYSPTGAPNADGTPRLTGAPSEVVLTRVTLPEFAPRRIAVRSENVRVVAGLRGRLGTTWKWESALLYGGAKTTDRESNAIKESELRDALARTTPATALNPFMTTFTVANGALVSAGQPFTNPESVVAPLRGTFYREGETSLGSWDIRVQGRLAGLPAGEIGLAAGAEYRRETYRDFREPESGRLTAADVERLGLRAGLAGDNNFLQVSPSDNTDADLTVQAAFVEIAAPMLRDERRVFFRSLELSAAARIERTGDFGPTTKPSVGLSARVLPWLQVRAAVNETFRAPNLAVLFSGALQRSITGVPDAYRATVTRSTDDGSTARRISLRSGNSALKPETARTQVAGVVLAPASIKGFTIGIDVWKVDQTDALTRLDAPDIIAQDTALLTAATAASPATTIEQVDLSAAGSPNVLRNPVTQQDRDVFAAYNAGRPRAQQRAPVGTIRAIAESYLNASQRELAGIDFSLGYRTSLSRFGTAHARLEAAYLQRFDERLNPATPRADLSWRDGNTRWRGNITLGWKKDDWSASLFTSYTGRTQDSFLRTTTGTGPGVSPAGFLIVSESWLTNVSVTRNFNAPGLLGRTSLRLGINNVFDAAPPFGLGASSDTDGYLRGFGDPRGRAFSLEVTKRF